MITPTPKSVVSPILVGRTSALDSFEQWIDQAGDGAPRTLLVAGEAGVGKSRLTAEIKIRAAQRGWGTLQGNCFETDRALPYAPLLDLLHTFCDAVSVEEITQAFGPAISEIAKLLPELSLLLPNLVATPTLEPEPDKRRLFHLLTQFLVNLSGRQRQLVVIEDLHWGDATSLEFLLYLARRLATPPLRGRLLLTYRSDEAPPALTHFLADLDREHLAVEFNLPRLTQAEVEAMLRAIFNQLHPVRVEFQQAVYSLTEGNPFFIEEILKALMVAGEIFFVEAEGVWDRKPMSELHIPRSVQDAVQRRSERLSGAARQVLTLAAVAGRRFDFVLLQQLMRPGGVQPSEREEGELLGLIKELINAQLVVEESADRFAFRHALTRQAVYAQLLARERKTLHQQVAQMMEQVYANAAGREAHLGDLAYHFYEAGLWDKALEYAWRAGERAQSLYASQQAVEQFSRALDAARQASLALPLSLYHARGQAYEGLDDFERARADYQLGLEAAQARGDRLMEWQALLDLGTLWSGYDFVRGGDYFQRALEIARRLEDPVALAQTLNRVGNWHLNLGRPFEARRYHDEALAVFEGLHDKRGRAQTLDLLGITHYVCGDLVRGTACYEQSHGLFRELNDRQGMINSLTYLAVRSRFTADVLDVRSIAELIPPGETALRMAREMGWRSAETAILSCLAQCLSSLGVYGQALDLGQAAFQVAEEIQHREWLSGACWALGHIYHELLALPVARQQLERALASAREASSVIFVHDVTASLASTYVQQHELDRAEAVLAAVLDPGQPEQTWGQRLCECARAELALAQKDPARALQIVDRLLASAANVANYGPRAIPRLAYLRGTALAALDRPQEAEVELQAAREVALAQGRRPLLWHVELGLGQIYAAQRRGEAAQEAFASARRIVESLAASVPDDALRENFVRQAAALIPAAAVLSPRQAAKKEFGGLTEREREVAALVAQGKSNREIAQALVVSERTAATHVGNILSKLAFASRAQIAAWAVENGLAHPLLD